MSSCYTYSYTVGDGPVTGISVKEKNHYLIGGLAPVGISDANTMIGDAENYEVNVNTKEILEKLLNMVQGMECQILVR